MLVVFLSEFLYIKWSILTIAQNAIVLWMAYFQLIGSWVLQVSELERSQRLIKQHINQAQITFNAQLKTVVPSKNISLPFAWR